MKLLFKVIVEPVNSEHVLVIPTTTDVCVCGQSTIRWSEDRTLCIFTIAHDTDICSSCPLQF